MLIGRKSTERREVEPAEAQRCTFVTSSTVEARDFIVVRALLDPRCHSPCRWGGQHRNLRTLPTL